MLRKQINYIEIVKLLYPEVFDITSTFKFLAADKVLCLSDTANVFVNKTEPSRSLAVNIERQMLKTKKNKGKDSLELIQADSAPFVYSSSKKNFGAHLPQNKGEPRREYLHIDNTEFKPTENYDLVLGRRILCCCEDAVSCGGIKSNAKDQKQFISSIMATNADLIVLSGTNLKLLHANPFHEKGKNLLLETCKDIALSESNYEFIFDHDLVTNLNALGIPLVRKNYISTGYLLIIVKKSVLELINLPPHATQLISQDYIHGFVSSFKLLTQLPKLTFFNPVKNPVESMSVHSIYSPHTEVKQESKNENLMKLQPLNIAGDDRLVSYDTHLAELRPLKLGRK